MQNKSMLLIIQCQKIEIWITHILSILPEINYIYIYKYIDDKSKKLIHLNFAILIYYQVILWKGGVVKFSGWPENE